VISTLFNTLFYNPIYNALVTFVALVPGADAGVAIIVLTIAIRLALLPFSLSAARTQRMMKILEPKIKDLREKHKGDKEREARETLALYRESKVNPFASFLIVFVQIPVLLALYFVFLHEPLTSLNVARLYAVTPRPEHVSLQFLGMISVMGKSLTLAILAGVTQFLQARMALKGTMKPSDTKGMQQDFQKVMGMQLQFVFPFLIATISFSTGAAIALYFITTNLAGIWQEWYVREKLTDQAAI
jgi:YidC/Oxa1 family membrane protein insertase